MISEISRIYFESLTIVFSFYDYMFYNKIICKYLFKLEKLFGFFADLYSQLPNKRGGRNKRGGWENGKL